LESQIKKDKLNFEQEQEKATATIKDLSEKCKKFKTKIEEHTKPSLKNMLLSPLLSFEDSSDSDIIKLICQNNDQTRVVKFELTPFVDKDRNREMIQYTPIHISSEHPLPEFMCEEIFIHRPDLAILLSKIILEVTV